jgi:hypothetical protein
VIVDLIVVALFGIVNAVFGLIPEFSVYSGEAEGTYWGASVNLGEFLAAWDLFQPIELMFTCLLLILGTKAFVAVAQFLVWLWSILPFKSS